MLQNLRHQSTALVVTVFLCALPAGFAAANEEDSRPTEGSAHQGPAIRRQDIECTEGPTIPAASNGSTVAESPTLPLPGDDSGEVSEEREIVPGVSRALKSDSPLGSAQEDSSKGEAENPCCTSLSDCLTVPNFRDDFHSFPAGLWDDTKSLFTVGNGISLALNAGITAIIAHNWDDEVRDDVAQHPRRWGGFNNVMDVVGHPITHAGVAGSLYAVSLITDNPREHAFAKALINALILTDGLTVALKYSFDTERPNGQDYGFPSGHTSSSFAVAAVISEYYGPTAGQIAYVTAGLVGWSRIDNRNHDLSDVVFGAALGYMIGQTVAHHHLLEEHNLSVAPYSDPNNGIHGISIEHKY
ncbi:MAG: phosphatase PAP2 family protein [Planctomycetota bacterium]